MKKLYSFDLFDTLVERGVNHPNDIFSLVETTGVIKYRFFFLKFISFKRLRIYAEKISRKLTKNEEIDLFDIYRILSIFISNPSVVLKKEILLELSLIKPIDKRIIFYNEVRNSGIEVCITSDMYLPLNVIKKILLKNNIISADIFLSSNILLTKASGNLFKYISSVKKIDFSEIKHYGDNSWSDFSIPKSLGIDAVHIGNPYHRESFGYLDSFKSPNQEDEHYRIGYEFCGPISYYFSKFISEKKNNSANLIFGARDSYLFKSAYDTFFCKTSDKKNNYVRISRSLVYLPEVFHTKNMRKLFEGNIQCDEFFERLDLDCPLIFKGKHILECKKELEFFLLNNELFIERLKRNNKSVTNYLFCQGFCDDVAFIDMGWRGSIQDSLNMILTDNVNIVGYYLGTLDKHAKKNGFLFHNKRPYKRYFYIMQCIGWFENLFTEPQPSLKNIKDFDGGYDYEFVSDESIGQLESRKRISAGAEQFFKDFYDLRQNIELDDQILLRSISKLLKKNTMSINDSTISAFKGLQHSAGFSGSLVAPMIEFKDYSLIGYLKSPWKAYFMYELKKKSYLRYILFSVFFHHFIFFIFFQKVKVYYHRLRRLVGR